ncbi:TPA: Cof-type HAD-IIB family hydrolase [Streptococcus suis]|uniref:Cof-type HAD-IIB family hydrolase n=1 Tax=Streptococcus sp. FSL E2-3494 TaxID=2954729 RepID=UPI0030FCC6CD
MQKKEIGQLLSLKKRLSDFKLLALDMDGTSLDSSGKLPIELINFVNRENFGDLIIVFATGRMPLAVYNSLERLNISKVVISHNGAVISNLENGKCYYENHVPSEIVQFSIELHKRFQVPLHLNLTNEVITDKITSMSKEYAKHLGINIKKGELSTIEETVISLLFLSEKSELDNILRQIMDKFKNFSYVLIPDKSFWLLQILPENTSKGEGVTHFAKILNILKEDIISFGDSYNDIEMLLNSGIGIAMGNSCEELKEIADYITLSNDENGVLKALQNLLL